MDIQELIPILEAIIYVADDPVKAEQLKEIFPDESYDKIEGALEKLAAEFNGRPGGMCIREIAGGFRMATRPEHHEFIRAYLKSKPGAKLSMAALETLAPDRPRVARRFPGRFLGHDRFPFGSSGPVPGRRTRIRGRARQIPPASGAPRHL